MGKIEKISCKDIYPIESINSIDPKIMDEAIRKMRENTQEYAIGVIQYEGTFYLIYGVYDFIGLCRNGMTEVDAAVLDMNEIPICRDSKVFDMQLQEIGMNAVYDFEALTGVSYSSIPNKYRGE